MKTRSKKRAVLAALIGLLLTSFQLPAFAGVNDYEFQLVQSEMKKSAGAIVAVRLVNKKTGKTVPGAVIFAKRIDMAPDGMETMQESLDPLPATSRASTASRPIFPWPAAGSFPWAQKSRVRKAPSNPNSCCGCSHDPQGCNALDPRRAFGGGGGRVLDRTAWSRAGGDGRA